MTAGHSIYRTDKICYKRFLGIKKQQGKKQMEVHEDAGKITWGQVESLRSLIQEDQVKYERWLLPISDIKHCYIRELVTHIFN